MSASQNFDDSFGTSPVVGGGKGGGSVDDIKPYLEGSERLKVYIALVALLEGGMPLDDAVSVLSREYRRDKTAVSLRKSKAIELFFGGLQKGSSPQDVVDLASKSFGAAFLEPEEAAVLSLIGAGGGVAHSLKACRAILEVSD